MPESASTTAQDKNLADHHGVTHTPAAMTRLDR